MTLVGSDDFDGVGGMVWKEGRAIVFHIEWAEDIFLWVEILSSKLTAWTFQSYK